MVFDQDNPIEFDPTQAGDSMAYVKRGRVYAEVVNAEHKIGDFGPGIKVTWQAMWPNTEAGNLVADTLWFSSEKGLARTKLVMKRLGLLSKYEGGVIKPSDFKDLRSYISVTPREVGDRVFGNVDYDGYQQANDDMPAPPKDECTPVSFGKTEIPF